MGEVGGGFHDDGEVHCRGGGKSEWIGLQSEAGLRHAQLRRGQSQQLSILVCACGNRWSGASYSLDADFGAILSPHLGNGACRPHVTRASWPSVKSLLRCAVNWGLSERTQRPPTSPSGVQQWMSPVRSRVGDIPHGCDLFKTDILITLRITRTRSPSATVDR